MTSDFTVATKSLLSTCNAGVGDVAYVQAEAKYYRFKGGDADNLTNWLQDYLVDEDHDETQTDLDTAEATITAHGLSIVDLDATATNHGTSILDLDATVTNHGLSIVDLDATVTNHGVSILDLDATVTAHGTSILDLTADEVAFTPCSTGAITLTENTIQAAIAQLVSIVSDLHP